MTETLLERWLHQVREITLQPSRGGRFEIRLNGELIFSKAALGRHAEPGEIEALVSERMG